jgi:hypothetical protein
MTPDGREQPLVLGYSALDLDRRSRLWYTAPRCFGFGL